MFFQNLIVILNVPVVIIVFIIGNLTKNVCNGKVSNANNEFIVTNV